MWIDSFLPPIFIEIFHCMKSGKLCPLSSHHDSKYTAKVALFSLLLNVDFLEGSFPDGGQQAVRSSSDWSQSCTAFYKAEVTAAWAIAQ
jgi:hypothetical protein